MAALRQWHCRQPEAGDSDHRMIISDPGRVQVSGHELWCRGPDSGLMMSVECLDTTRILTVDLAEPWRSDSDS